MKQKSDIAPVNGHQMKWTWIVLLRPVAPWIKQPTLTEKRTSDILFCYSPDVTLSKLMVWT